MDPEPWSSARRRLRLRIAAVVLAVYVACLLAVVLAPVQIDRPFEGLLDALLAALHARGLPAWFGYPELEFAANLLLFLPAGLLAALVLPSRRWWLVAAVSPVLSAVLELGQAVFLSGRSPSVRDVLANGLGGAAGALISALVQGLLGRGARRGAQRSARG